MHLGNYTIDRVEVSQSPGKIKSPFGGETELGKWRNLRVDIDPSRRSRHSKFRLTDTAPPAIIKMKPEVDLRSSGQPAKSESE
ncbi:hypothetical protein RJT34_09451 [Clitoria ternatea]|uniref:Uncharacterized protein n=1 Tax=Clitoria ternatea TaxID=43366 RepID=A0AAN9PUM8_CLITE